MSHRTTKPTKWPVCPSKTRTSLGIRPVWSESLLSVSRNLRSSATHWEPSKDADQTGHTCHFVYIVMRWLKLYIPLLLYFHLNGVFAFMFFICIPEFGFKDREGWNGSFRDIYSKGTVLFSVFAIAWLHTCDRFQRGISEVFLSFHGDFKRKMYRIYTTFFMQVREI